MPSLCLYFQVHQPVRLRRYSFFEIGKSQDYEDESANRAILSKVASKCYLPATAILLKLVRQFRGDFRLSFSISGVVLDQFARFAPGVIRAFQRLADTGCVEFLNETYYHSLASVYSRDEFTAQVEQHRRRVTELFGQKAVTFRNTELIYNDDLARTVSGLGYKVMLAEGVDRVLRGETPDRIYRAFQCPGLSVLARNYRFSDDIAFRFPRTKWKHKTLTADLFARQLRRASKTAQVMNLFMDFETFGEHHWAETGILGFLKDFPGAILAGSGFDFQTPAGAARIYPAERTLKVPQYTSWADTERDLSAWLGNTMQKDAAGTLYAMEPEIRKDGSPERLRQWRRLQTSDHFYYMCTKRLGDGDVHDYFNPHPSPYDAYIAYMNVLADLRTRLRITDAAKPPKPLRRKRGTSSRPHERC